MKVIKEKKTHILLLIVFMITGSWVFFYNSKAKHTRIFVTFNQSDLPHAEISIEGKPYSVLTNLSSHIPLTLNKNVLESIIKKPSESIKFKDENGDIIEQHTYIIPEFKIGELSFKNVTVAEGEADPNNPQRMGTIGMPLLKKNNLLFDFHHSTIIACNNKHQLKKIGYILEEMVKLPFEMLELAAGVNIPVSMDGKIVRLALSTGCTVSFLDASLPIDKEIQKDDVGEKFTCSHLVIGEKDWGAQDVYIKDFSQLPELHGLIGMDFLMKHVFYLDFENNTVYIGNKH